MFLIVIVAKNVVVAFLFVNVFVNVVFYVYYFYFLGDCVLCLVVGVLSEFCCVCVCVIVLFVFSISCIVKSPSLSRCHR